MNAACFDQLAHHSWYTAGAEEALTEVLTGWLHVNHQWYVETDLLPIFHIELYANVTSDGLQVWWRIR